MDVAHLMNGQWTLLQKWFLVGVFEESDFLKLPSKYYLYSIVHMYITEVIGRYNQNSSSSSIQNQKQLCLTDTRYSTYQKAVQIYRLTQIDMKLYNSNKLN